MNIPYVITRHISQFHANAERKVSPSYAHDCFPVYLSTVLRALARGIPYHK